MLIRLPSFLWVQQASSLMATLQGHGWNDQVTSPMALYPPDTAWLGDLDGILLGLVLRLWPMMAIFIARISRGRTIRQMIVSISIVAPLVTCFWFSIVGGSGLAFELENPAWFLVRSRRLQSSCGITCYYCATAIPDSDCNSVPYLTTTFIVTTGDSMTYTISVDLWQAQQNQTRQYAPSGASS